MSEIDADDSGRNVAPKSAAVIDYFEQKSIFDGYARLYGPLTVAAIGLVFMPFFDDLMVDSTDGTVRRSFGTLWDMASRPAGDPAVLGILLAIVLAALCGVAAFRPRSQGLPIAISAVCVPIIIMLITKPATGDPKPDLSPDGAAGLAIAIFACALGIVHAIHFHWWVHDDSARRAAMGLK